MIKDFKTKKKDIRKRLKEFKELNKAPKNKKFLELCYCLCTPLSNAKKVYGVINEKNKRILINGNKRQVQGLLKGNCRFHNNKAKYIIQARDFIKRADIMTKRINRVAWDGSWYSRGFTDFGTVYGSARNKEGKIFLKELKKIPKIIDLVWEEVEKIKNL